MGDGERGAGGVRTESRSLRRAHAQTAPCTRACALGSQKDIQGFRNWNVVFHICFITDANLFMLCCVGSAVGVVSVRSETVKISVCVV